MFRWGKQRSRLYLEAPVCRNVLQVHVLVCVSINTEDIQDNKPHFHGIIAHTSQSVIRFLSQSKLYSVQTSLLRLCTQCIGKSSRIESYFLPPCTKHLQIPKTFRPTSSKSLWRAEQKMTKLSMSTGSHENWTVWKTLPNPKCFKVTDLCCSPPFCF